MAWIGVPFTSAAAWAGYNWTALDFWQQFDDAAAMRLQAYFEVQSRVFGGGFGTTYSSGSLNPSSASWVNTQRVKCFQNGATYWVDKAGLVTGNNIEDDARFFTSGIQCTQAFVDAVNAILTAAGCPTMGTAPVTDADSRGIPFTRKHGSLASPSTSYGSIQPGDWPGAHIFNEWYAVLMAADCLQVNMGDANLRDVRTHSVFAEAWGTDCADARSGLATDFAAATPTESTGGDQPAYLIADGIWYAADNIYFTTVTVRGRWEIHDLGDCAELSEIWTVVTPEEFNGIYDFYGYGGDGKVEDEIWSVSKDTSPAAGDWNTPYVGDETLNAIADATGSPCPTSGNDWSRGYRLAVRPFCIFDFPDP